MHSPLLATTSFVSFVYVPPGSKLMSTHAAAVETMHAKPRAMMDDEARCGTVRLPHRRSARWEPRETGFLLSLALPLVIHCALARQVLSDLDGFSLFMMRGGPVVPIPARHKAAHVGCVVALCAASCVGRAQPSL